MRICVVGQSVKDIYLQINGNFLSDENGIQHLDLAFDGSEHPVSRRTAVKSGSAVAAEVLFRLGHVVDYLDDAFLAHRYILNNGESSVVFQTSRPKVLWQPPREVPDAIFIDDIESLASGEIQKIKKYAAQHDIILYGHHGDASLLQGQPDFCVFLDKPLDELGFFANGIKYHIKLDTPKGDVQPLASLQALAHASLFGAWLLGYDATDCLAIAKGLIERTTLTHSPRLAEVLEHLPALRQFVYLEGSPLAKTAQAILKKGILAADESGGSIAKKFASLNIPDDPQHRRDYRNIFLGLPELAQHVSGVILFDETTTQLADNGQNFTDFLNRQGILPGVKVDQGLADLGKKGEKSTLGLDGLPSRLATYHERGLRFAKWRAAFFVGDGTPSPKAIDQNCQALAQYALDCQAAGIVPIVEPELVHDGNYSLEDCAKITTKILTKLFDSLREYQVELPATILKVNMILAGKQYKKSKKPAPSTPAEVGRATADVLKRTVPPELAGVVFLSGGQSPDQATANLHAVWAHGPFPWPITYSFARALQDPALTAWKGNNQNTDKARRAFQKRLLANQKA
ncbi:fructose-bisphosphate aldolase class I [Candidatus Saccharibacteria bacterium]|nr:fructose-bisphosphate aldolase class I [Candidatus Saccharibacteria bacterium]